MEAKCGAEIRKQIGKVIFSHQPGYRSQAAESGWITDGNDLGRGGRFGTFMVRFGMEGGEQRAYFTAVGRPTICDLRLTGPDELQIFATNAGVPSE